MQGTGGNKTITRFDLATAGHQSERSDSSSSHHRSTYSSLFADLRVSVARVTRSIVSSRMPRFLGETIGLLGGLPASITPSDIDWSVILAEAERQL